jgi:hypothetical protein
MGEVTEGSRFERVGEVVSERKEQERISKETDSNLRVLQSKVGREDFGSFRENFLARFPELSSEQGVALEGLESDHEFALEEGFERRQKELGLQVVNGLTTEEDAFAIIQEEFPDRVADGTIYLDSLIRGKKASDLDRRLAESAKFNQANFETAQVKARDPKNRQAGRELVRIHNLSGPQADEILRISRETHGLDRGEVQRFQARAEKDIELEDAALGFDPLSDSPNVGPFRALLDQYSVEEEPFRRDLMKARIGAILEDQDRIDIWMEHFNENPLWDSKSHEEIYTLISSAQFDILSEVNLVATGDRTATSLLSELSDPSTKLGADMENLVAQQREFIADPSQYAFIRGLHPAEAVGAMALMASPSVDLFRIIEMVTNMAKTEGELDKARFGDIPVLSSLNKLRSSLGEVFGVTPK